MKEFDFLCLFVLSTFACICVHDFWTRPSQWAIMETCEHAKNSTVKSLPIDRPSTDLYKLIYVMLSQPEPYWVAIECGAPVQVMRLETEIMINPQATTTLDDTYRFNCELQNHTVIQVPWGIRVRYMDPFMEAREKNLKSTTVCIFFRMLYMF